MGYTSHPIPLHSLLWPLYLPCHPGECPVPIRPPLSLTPGPQMPLPHLSAHPAWMETNGRAPVRGIWEVPGTVAVLQIQNSPLTPIGHSTTLRQCPGPLTHTLAFWHKATPRSLQELTQGGQGEEPTGPQHLDPQPPPCPLHTRLCEGSVEPAKEASPLFGFCFCL